MGSVRLYGATSGYLELQAPDVAPDAALVLPSDSLQPGLVHLHTESFSAQSSVSIDDVFSATYDNYWVTWVVDEAAVSVARGLRFRFRASGADDTTSQYRMYRDEINSSGTVTNNTYLQSVLYAGGTGASGGSGFMCNFDIGSPFKTERSYLNAAYTSPGVGGVASLTMNTNTSYDGFTVFLTAETMTGSVSVYGYRNS
jgi:hypothetical protein